MCQFDPPPILLRVNCVGFENFSLPLQRTQHIGPLYMLVISQNFKLYEFQALITWSKHNYLALKSRTDAISNVQYKRHLTNFKS